MAIKMSLPTTKKYVEDYTISDWTTNAWRITPRAVRGAFTEPYPGQGSILGNKIPNIFNGSSSSYAKFDYDNGFFPSSPPTITHTPAAFLTSGIKSSKKSDISIFIVIPSATSASYYLAGSSTITEQFYTPDTLPIGQVTVSTSPEWGPLWDGTIKVNSNNNSWIYRSGTNFGTVRGLTKYKTINISSSLVYDIYELTSYSRDSAPSTEYEFLYQFPTNDGKKLENYGETTTSGWYYNALGWMKDTMKMYSADGYAWGSGSAHINSSSYAKAPYYIDDRKLNIKFYTYSDDYSTPISDKIYSVDGTYYIAPYLDEGCLQKNISVSATIGNSSTSVSLGSSTLDMKSGASSVNTVYGTSKWWIWKRFEQYILPSNALVGPLTVTVTYSITLPTWNRHIGKDGATIYDDGNYAVTNSYTYNYQVDMSNIPSLTTAIGTRFRNHNAKYAVLANDADYFEYSWKGVVQYAADPTVTLTMSYGDQVVVSKTMDGTASATSTFQHGPFLNVPTTEGQLVQITGIVTDARGRASAEKVFTITDNNSQDNLEYLRFYNYNYPTVMVQGYRCTADGTPDADAGTHVKLTATYAFSQLDYGLTTYSEGTTDGNLYIKLRPHSGTLSQSEWNYTITTANGNKEILLEIGLNQSVDISVAVTDFIGNKFTASTEFVPSAQVVLDFRAGGNGLAIGKRNEFADALEVAWDTTFYGNVNFRGNVNISGSTQAATSADAVTYYDTYNTGARNVQTAIDYLANKAGVSTTQVQAIVNQAISNLDILSEDEVNALITTKINNIVFPPSISEARALELIDAALADFNPGIDEASVTAIIDGKLTDYAKKDELNPLATKSELTTGYYNKQEVDKKIEDNTVSLSDVQTLVDQAVAEMPTNEEAVNIANEAKTLAEGATDTAGVAIVRANTAKETSENAETIANNAKTIAQGIDGKATQALENSGNALTTAAAANTTALEAKQIAQDAKDQIDSFIEANTPTAAEISYDDTASQLGATTVQSAIVTLARKPHLTQAQVNSLISEALKSYYTKSQIDTKFNNYYTKAQTNTQISTATADFRTEAQIQAMIDAKFNSIVNGNNVAY